MQAIEEVKLVIGCYLSMFAMYKADDKYPICKMNHELRRTATKFKLHSSFIFNYAPAPP